MKIYIFAFFLHLGQWCHIHDKSRFQHEDNSRVTPHSDSDTNNNGGRREMRVFLAGNTVIILSSCQLKMKMLRFVVYCAGDKVLSCFKKHVRIEETFAVAAQLGLQSKSHQVLSRELLAKPRPWPLQEVPHHPNYKSWIVSTSKRYIVNLALLLKNALPGR